MRLRFVNYRAPESADALQDHERAQLVSAGRAWDDQGLSAEERLAPGGGEGSFLGFVHVWDVVDDDNGGQLAYTYWSYMVDSGAFFVGKTERYDADVIQFYLHNPSSQELAVALAEAAHRQHEELRRRGGFRVSPRLLEG